MALNPPSDLCVCQGTKRFRPPSTTLGLLRRFQDNKCYYCKENPVECVAHLCNNNTCRNENHLTGSCNSCNARISNLARGVSKRYAKASVCVPGEGEEDSLSKNRRCEPAWVEYVQKWIDARGPLPQDIVTDNSAHDIGLSVYTIKSRYWRKYSCDSGPFRLFRPEGSTIYLVDVRRGPQK